MFMRIPRSWCSILRDERSTGSSAAPAQRSLIRDLKEIFADPLPFDQLISKARSQADDFQVQFEAGKRAFQRQDYDKARQYLSRAGKLSEALGVEERADTMSLLTVVCFKSGKYQEALDALDAMSRLDPKYAAQSADLKLLRARILVNLNRDDEAFELMNAMLRASPSRSTKDTVKELSGGDARRSIARETGSMKTRLRRRRKA